MAMILQRSRLRVTQAIYFGKPPVTGGTGTVTSVGAGTGITLAPSPIIGAGTVSLTVPVAVSSGGTGAITLTGVLRGNGVGAITGGASVSLTTDVTGILPVANGGSGVGTITGLLRGNGVGVFTGAAQASLTTEVSGILPYANGGTNASTAWTQGSVIFAGATSYVQDNANLFWNDATNRLGIGTAAPTSPLTVNGTIEIANGSGGVLKFADGTSQASAAVGGGNISGAGVATNVAFFTAGQTLSSDNAFYWDNVNKRLGIGTNTPSETLHVFGGAATRLRIETSGATTNALLVLQGPTHSWTIAHVGTAGGFGAEVLGIRDATVGAYRLVFDPSGHISIGWGVALGASVLDIKDDTATCLRLSGSTSGFVGLRPAAAAGSTTYELPAADGAPNQFLQTTGAAVLQWATPAGGGTVTVNGVPSAGMVSTFFNATAIQGSSNFFWDSGNNRLGILNSTPLAPLHVGGGAGAPGYSSQILIDVNGAAFMTAKDVSDSAEAVFGANATGAVVGSVGNSDLNLQTNATTRVKIMDTTGYMAVGTSHPTPILAPIDVVADAVSNNAFLIRGAAGGPYANFIFSDNAGATSWGNWNAGPASFDVNPAASGHGPANFGGPVHGSIQDVGFYGGQVFSVKAYGAIGNGIANDTTAIQNTITTAAGVTPRGVVFFPPGTYLTAGNYDLSGMDGLKIKGSGWGNTVIKISSPTNDCFFATGQLANIGISDLTFDASVIRTAGWCFNYSGPTNNTPYLSRSKFTDIHIINQLFGFKVEDYEFVWFTRCMADVFTGTTGIAFQVGAAATGSNLQRAELYFTDCQVDGNAGPPGWAWWLENCDAVYFNGCGAVGIAEDDIRITCGPVYDCHNLFIANTVCDFTKNGHGVYVTGAGAMRFLSINGLWCASAGQIAGGSATSCGFKMDCANVFVHIQSSRFYNNRDAGVRITGDNVGTISNSMFFGNSYGIDLLGGTLNNLNAVITGNYEFNDSVASIQTSNQINRIVVTGNRWTTATNYGVAPLVNANNGA